MVDLPTNWVDNVGMIEDAAFLNALGVKVNAVAGASGVKSVASSATPSVDAGTYRQLNITALATAITGVTVTNPYDGHRLLIRIKDNGTARGIALGSTFRAAGASLPKTTFAGMITYVECVYNAVGSVYDVIRVSVQTVVTFDTLGAAFSGRPGVGVGQTTWTHTSGQDYVLACMTVDRAVSSPSATFATKAMTLLANVNLNGSNGTGGVLLVFGFDMKANNIAAGTNTIVLNQGVDAFVIAQSISYPNVSYAGTPVIVQGSASAPSQAVSSLSDGIVAQMFGAADPSSGAFTPSGGTNRYNGSTAGGSIANTMLSLSDASAPATFTAAQAKANWAGVVVPLAP